MMARGTLCSFLLTWPALMAVIIWIIMPPHPSKEWFIIPMWFMGYIRSSHLQEAWPPWSSLLQRCWSSISSCYTRWHLPTFSNCRVRILSISSLIRPQHPCNSTNLSAPRLQFHSALPLWASNGTSSGILPRSSKEWIRWTPCTRCSSRIFPRDLWWWIPHAEIRFRARLISLKCSLTMRRTLP